MMDLTVRISVLIGILRSSVISQSFINLLLESYGPSITEIIWFQLLVYYSFTGILWS